MYSEYGTNDKPDCIIASSARVCQAMEYEVKKWILQGTILRPPDYESGALTN